MNEAPRLPTQVFAFRCAGGTPERRCTAVQQFSGGFWADLVLTGVPWRCQDCGTEQVARLTAPESEAVAAVAGT